jgi:hypothetical protein
LNIGPAPIDLMTTLDEPLQGCHDREFIFIIAAWVCLKQVGVIQPVFLEANKTCDQSIVKSFNF